MWIYQKQIYNLNLLPNWNCVVIRLAAGSTSPWYSPLNPRAALNCRNLCHLLGQGGLRAINWGYHLVRNAELNNNLYHRRSIRLADYDYSAEGGYFITIVTQGRVCLFGDVINGVVHLIDYGKIVWEEWFKTAKLRSNVELVEDEFVVMPNQSTAFFGLKVLQVGAQHLSHARV